MTSDRFYKLPMDLAARHDLTGNDKVILAIITNRIGINGKGWPGSRLLARESGLNRETVLACIDRLEKSGDLVVHRRGNGKGNHYSLPDKSGREPQPVGEPNRPETPTRGGRKLQPEAVGNSDRNKIDPLKKTHIATAKPPPDPRIKKFIDWFCDEYQRVRGIKYIVQGGKDAKNVQRLLKSMSLEELQRAVGSMFADHWGKDKADIGLLTSKINTWRGGESQKESSGNSDGFPALREPTPEEADDLLKGLDGCGTTAGGSQA
jgi:hypothetical protein